MASIRCRNGKWQARVRRRGHPDAEKTFSSRKDAEKWTRQIESEMDRGCFIDRTEAERALFGEVLQRYLQEVVPGKRGRETESVRIRALMLSDLANRSMANLNSKIIATWRDERLKQVSGSTVNRELNIISAVINTAIKEWGIALPNNPVTLIKRPRSGPPRNRRIDPAEEERLLQALEVAPRTADGRFCGPQNAWMKPLVQFALETAMRRGEMLGLGWEDVDLQRRVAHLKQTKNGDARTVPLSTEAVKVLDGLPRSLSGRVFPITSDAVKKAFSRACCRAKLTRVVFHTLRHEATSRLSEKLPNVIELAAITGHKDLRMLQRYYHPRPEALALKLV
ncbi:MAG TPA: site-specific integrase [Noviherbaspirillum sp.]|uniref:tyrosine-type recombinase/integrase n=1 Tax=Noviherbaspirillum sp. TaxID=1926288 RepID=UPI002D69ED1A|nr:site-specific integrase [Noviherbaspirillum sp.]HYD94390.1 site-specific integrase [Noviherbaspirillum sp.]